MASDTDEFPFRFETGIWYIKKNRAAPPPFPMLAVFLGDEEPSTPEGIHPGLEDLYAQLDEPENSPLVYLALSDAPRKLRIHHGSAGYSAPLSLLEPLTALLAKRWAGLYSLGIQHTEIYRLGLARGLPALNFVQRRDMPALALTSISGGKTGGAPLDAEALGEFLAEYGAAVDFSFERADTHYAIFVFGGRAGFLPERALTLLLLNAGGLCLLLFLGYGVIFRRRISILWSRGFVFFWVGPLLFGFLFLCCLGMGLFLNRLLNTLNVSPERVGFGGAFLVMLNGGLLFSLIAPLLNGLPIKGKAGLYGNTAVFMTAAGLLGGIFLDIGTGPGLLWILFCACLGAILKMPTGALVCAAASLLSPLTILLDSTETGRFMAIFQPRYILFFLGFTALTLPFYLLMNRAILLLRRRYHRPYRRRHTRYRLIMLRAALLFFSIGGLFFYGYRLSKLPERRVETQEPYHTISMVRGPAVKRSPISAEKATLPPCTEACPTGGTGSRPSAPEKKSSASLGSLKLISAV
jgi:hypothetical protein